MNSRDTPQGAKRLFGGIGLTCLLLILPVKALRFLDATAAGATLVGIAPSLLGPAGLLFLVLSGSGRVSRLSLTRVAVLVAVMTLALEFVQLLPRPGILAHVHYTFDWSDVLAGMISVGVSWLVAYRLRNRVSV